MSKLRYSSGYDDPQDEPDDFLDVTDDFEPDHEPEDYEADTRTIGRWSEADFAYDPLSRKGFE